MARISSELQCSTIANMIAVELKRLNIPVAGDEDLKYNIIYASAEYLLYFGIFNDLHECVNEIKNYIKETCSNYPNYFLTGEEN